MCSLTKLFKSSKYPGYGEGPTFSPVWGLIIPHQKDAQGATSFDNKYTEYTYAHVMAEMIGIPYMTRDLGGVAEAAHTLINNYKVNCLIETHFNAYNGKAHGYEILVMKGDDLSARYARFFLESFGDLYPRRRPRHDKGIKWVSKGDRGFHNLRLAKAAGADVAMLTELFFGDNIEDFIDPSTQAMFWRDHFVAER